MLVSKVAVPLVKHLLFYPQIGNVTSRLDFQYERVQQNLIRHVYTLAGIPRFTKNIQGQYEAANYIKKEWESMGLHVEEQLFRGPVGDPNVYKNLIVSFGPKNAPVVVLGAHYDSESKSQTPGADDNASGVAGILEVSRLLKEQNPKLTKRIDVVAYANEERPHCGLDCSDYADGANYEEYMGSYIHAESLKKANTPVVGAVILEMIGYYSNEENSQNYPFKGLKFFYPTKGDFIGVIGNLISFDLIQKVKTGLKQNSQVKVRSLSIPESVIRDVNRSDHHSYWKHGYQGLMISDTANFRTPHYHQKTDTPDTLDYDKMTEIVKGVYGTIISL